MSFTAGEILLVDLVLSSQTGTKRRPVMVVYSSEDDDLLVIPITSHVARGSYDITISKWQQSGLRVASVARTDKLASIAKSAVIQKLGRLTGSDFEAIRSALDHFFRTILQELA